MIIDEIGNWWIEIVRIFVTRESLVLKCKTSLCYGNKIEDIVNLHNKERQMCYCPVSRLQQRQEKV